MGAIVTYPETPLLRDVRLIFVTERAFPVYIQKYRGYVADFRRVRMRILMPLQPVYIEEAGVGDA